MSDRSVAVHAALAAAVVAFSTSGVLAKLCGASAVAVAFWVRIFSLAYLLGAFLVQSGRESRQLLARAGLHGLVGGLVFGVHILCYFWALKLTSVTVVFLLGALNPAVVGAAGWLLFGERLTPRQALWTTVAIAAAGFVVVARDASGASQLFGNAVALVASLGYCAYFLISRHARRDVGTLEYLTMATLSSILVVGMVAVAGDVPLVIDSGHDLALIAVMGLVPGTIGHVTVSWALRHIEAHAASTVLLAVPILASFWAYLFVGERVSTVQVIAGLVTLAAIPGAIRQPPGLAVASSARGGRAA